MPFNLIAGIDDSGRRLDRVLRKVLHQTPLSAIHRMLRQGCVLVNGCKADAGRRVLAGENITISDQVCKTQATGDLRSAIGGKVSRQKREKSFPEMPEILFEDTRLLILNKPAGIPVHGKGSLDQLIQPYLGPKLRPSLSFRPGPLHRLDKPSSGVLVFSAGLEGARLFSAMMREGKIKKQYLAIAEGLIENAEVWEDELFRDKNIKKTFTGSQSGNDLDREKGKTAVTRVSPLIGQKNYSLILLETDTGRTHQIRVQAASRCHPLLGDKKYGAGFLSGGFLLHAWRLKLPPPFPPVIEAPLPENFKTAIKKLFGADSKCVLAKNISAGYFQGQRPNL
jgi:23S rRNA pseudouridine955/2504/2580 synthase